MTFEEQAATMSREDVVALLASHQALADKFDSELGKAQEEVTQLKRRVAWFERQLFGQKSEKRILSETKTQLCLGELLETDENPPPAKETVKTYERRQRRKFPDLVDDDSNLRFDSSVPVKEIVIPNPEVEGLSAEQYEILPEKVTYRLAQEKGPYVVLKYVRRPVKIKETGEITCPSAPPAVIERSFADVSFIVGLILDKIRYYLPLHRQHQRLEACGIHMSRVTLTNLITRAAQLMEPVYLALFSSILQSKVLAMDETPVRAGRSKPGKMKKSYFWPIYGDKDEIVFLFAASRATTVVMDALEGFGGTLISDGLRVYERFANQMPGVTRAQCWAHVRRYFDEGKDAEPVLCNKALDYIADLFALEDRAKGSQPEERLALRAEYSRPVVNDFFTWLSEAFQQKVLLPSNPFTRAANYALDRRAALRVFLENPAVPLSTNHLERALRPIPMGRKNWLFCWTELGARVIGILQSLIASCRLQEVDCYTYLVDVLQRIDSHPACDVHLLTPRLWKEHFAKDPMVSDLNKLQQNAAG